MSQKCSNSWDCITSTSPPSPSFKYTYCHSHSTTHTHKHTYCTYYTPQTHIPYTHTHTHTLTPKSSDIDPTNHDRKHVLLEMSRVLIASHLLFLFRYEDIQDIDFIMSS